MTTNTATKGTTMSITTSTGRIIPTGWTKAVGRFNPAGPDGYRAVHVPNAPLRATRAEALEDERAYWEQRDRECPDCGASGYATTYDGRTLGPCTTCKGPGGQS